MKLGLAPLLLVLAGCAHQAEVKTQNDEKALAACIAQEAAKELTAGSSPLDAAGAIALVCGTDAETVTRDLIFGMRYAASMRKCEGAR